MFFFSGLYELVETSNVETKSYFENLNEKFDKSSQQQVLHRNVCFFIVLWFHYDKQKLHCYIFLAIEKVVQTPDERK